MEEIELYGETNETVRSRVKSVFLSAQELNSCSKIIQEIPGSSLTAATC
jgi:hypothetical protein